MLKSQNHLFLPYKCTHRVYCLVTSSKVVNQLLIRALKPVTHTMYQLNPQRIKISRNRCSKPLEKLSKNNQKAWLLIYRSCQTKTSENKRNSKKTKMKRKHRPQKTLKWAMVYEGRRMILKQSLTRNLRMKVKPPITARCSKVTIRRKKGLVVILVGKGMLVATIA